MRRLPVRTFTNRGSRTRCMLRFLARRGRGCATEIKRVGAEALAVGPLNPSIRNANVSKCLHVLKRTEDTAIEVRFGIEDSLSPVVESQAELVAGNSANRFDAWAGHKGVDVISAAVVRRGSFSRIELTSADLKSS